MSRLSDAEFLAVYRARLRQSEEEYKRRYPPKLRRNQQQVVPLPRQVELPPAPAPKAARQVGLFEASQ